MKKLLLLICMMGCITPLIARKKRRARSAPPAQPIQPAQPAQQGWTTVSAEQMEYHYLMLQIAKINEYFSSIGAYKSSGRKGQIVSFLRSVGTPVALQLLADLQKNGLV